MFKSKILIIPVLLLMVLLGINNANADFLRNKDGKSISSQPKEQQVNSGDRLLLRKYETVFDLQENTISNFDFYSTNYGILFFDVKNQKGGGHWPRGSQNQYLFAGGIWFGAQKNKPGKDSSERFKMVSITYNPNSGKGWYVPGRINLGGPGSTEYPDVDEVVNSDMLLYRTYFSSDFQVATGLPLNSADGANWPLWDASTNEEDTLQQKGYFGYYIPNNNVRNLEANKKGPAFISGEDIFATYKDTDLNYYEGGFARKATGYPLRLQIEQVIYSWGFGDYKDFIFVKYDITNYSNDTLRSCWLAPIMDVDIAREPATSFGAGNDKVRFYDSDTSLNLCVQWTMPDRFEGGNGFGYLGFDFLESPITCHDFERYPCRYDTTWTDSTHTIIARIDTGYCPREIITDSTSFLRKDKDYAADDNGGKYYKTHTQLGLKTFRNWNIADDKNTDEERYQFISEGVIDPFTDDAGDKRFMMATGPFHIRPHDTIRTVVALVFANTSKGAEADGTDEDMAELVRRDKFAQAVYDNYFLAPRPPDQANIINWTGQNNAVTIKWDSTSEVSSDANERGMAFLGYRIFRARRTDLDTFNISNISGDADYPLGRGPLGWKLVAQYFMQTPFEKSVLRGGTSDNDLAYPLIDRIFILGPNYKDVGIIDTNTIKIMRIGKGMQNDHFSVNVMRAARYTANPGSKFLPVINNIDTSLTYMPWGKYYLNSIKNDPTCYIDSVNKIYRLVPNGNKVDTVAGLTYTTPNAVYPQIFHDALFGYIKINPSLLKWNPLFYETKGVTRSGTVIQQLRNVENFQDGGIGPLKDTVQINKVTGLPDTLKIRTSVDSIYYWNTIVPSDKQGFYSIQVGFKRANVNDVTYDGAFITQLEDTMYQYVKRGWVQFVFPDFEQTEDVKQKVIVPYMGTLTNHRTFTDIGDLNNNGIIDTDLDPDRTEKLFNNVPYFYKVLAYDEGDYNQPTPTKINVGQVGNPNLAETNASAAPIGNKSDIEIIHIDSSLMGGLYNFNFYSVDQQRLQQNFAGHILELSFNPIWANSTFLLERFSAGDVVYDEVGLYRTQAILRDTTTNDTLFNSIILYEPQPCNFSIYGLFSEWAATYVGSRLVVDDSIAGTKNDFGTFYGSGEVTRTGRFTTGNFNQSNWCYSMIPNSLAYGTIGMSFDYTIEQFGGHFRPDSATLKGLYEPGVTANVPIKFYPLVYNRNPREMWKSVYTTQPVKINYSTWGFDEASYNNGPGEYKIEFLPGGVETVDLSYDNGATIKTFNIPYLNVKVTNMANFKRPSENGGDSLTVQYPSDIPFMELPIWQGKNVENYPAKNPDGSTLVFSTLVDSLYKFDFLEPTPMNRDRINNKVDNEFIGKFNLYSKAWVNFRNKPLIGKVDKYYALVNKPPFDQFMKNGKFTKSYSGLTQGRYYLTGVSQDGKDTVDFVNVFDISGVLFASDFINQGAYSPDDKGALGKKADYSVYTAQDFKAGDAVTVKTTGGALGLPMPGAKVFAKVTPSIPENQNYSDGMLDDILVVPNPYYISHAGEKSPYDSKIYFTKLPKQCTIEIYTVAGNLIKKINHDDMDIENDKASIEVWDLLSKNGQRIQSQSLVAVISTPDGAKTVKNFSVVVGGFRLISE